MLGDDVKLGVVVGDGREGEGLGLYVTTTVRGQ
jgi:hypothetical protein